MADYVAYFGGQWLPFSEVKIDPMDRGFLVGDCVFDVARTFNGKSFRMKAHVERHWAPREQLESRAGS